ncbi:efflux RND transporter periplasmic adaptor subunit [Lysobacter yangpyeongensis]|uniref:Efflux RND transporter periplasmic adaptor subunit n=1 Tax=Lysobacter yangpyeongensis TaxID=346182 RepID=A0ABW0SPW8_9GAMM
MARHDPSRTAVRTPSTRKRMFWMLLITVLVFGLVFGVKAFFAAQTNKFFDNMPQPPATISAGVAQQQSWRDSVEAVGTLVAVNGTQVTTESPGVISEIHFKPGDRVNAGDVLLQLNASTEIATLKSLEATARLNAVQADRYRELAARQLVSRDDADKRIADAASARAQADAQRALVARKTIRAPFSGVLGIRKVNLGQYVNPGDELVSLQSLDPIYLNFTLPEQRLPSVQTGTKVTAKVDAMPGHRFEGTITSVEPQVDPQTRNFQVQATLRNPDNALRPGTFARVSFDQGGEQKVVVIPQTAISFNPYGNSVYVITEAPAKAGAGQDKGKSEGAPAGPTLIAKQRFVKTGATHGDLIAVTEGLKPGERVATSGLLKLRNDATVVINNSVLPTAEKTPTPANR